jgi:hypothetical protein
MMKFKTEDDAYDAYLEYVQSEMPFDITEWDHDLSDGFYDWMDSNDVEIEE